MFRKTVRARALPRLGRSRSFRETIRTYAPHRDRFARQGDGSYVPRRHTLTHLEAEGAVPAADGGAADARDARPRERARVIVALRVGRLGAAGSARTRQRARDASDSFVTLVVGSFSSEPSPPPPRLRDAATPHASSLFAHLGGQRAALMRRVVRAAAAAAAHRPVQQKRRARRRGRPRNRATVTYSVVGQPPTPDTPRNHLPRRRAPQLARCRVERAPARAEAPLGRAEHDGYSTVIKTTKS